MTSAIPSWQAIRDAEDAKVRASGHAGLCSRARRIMPNLSAEDAATMRVAMLAGPGRGLRELVLKHFVALLAIVLLAGCAAQPRSVNPGADGPWKVTLAHTSRNDRDWRASGMQVEAGCTVVAWCNHDTHELRLAWNRSREELLADGYHELGHLLERDYARIWVVLDAMDSPTFPCGSDDLHRAQRVARRATQEAKP
jgi:hypothetical protein